MTATYIFPLSGGEFDEPLAKLGAAQCYRIRVVCIGNCAEQKFAVGAVRCGDSSEIELLSHALPSALEAVDLMRHGFTLREDASDLARAIVSSLNENTAIQLVA